MILCLAVWLRHENWLGLFLIGVIVIFSGYQARTDYAKIMAAERDRSVNDKDPG